jgi:hypothetical protein
MDAHAHPQRSYVCWPLSADYPVLDFDGSLDGLSWVGECYLKFIPYDLEDPAFMGCGHLS